MTSSHYVHGTDAAEQQRLSTLNELLNERCLQTARLTSGDRIIDLGAGLGQFSRAMARVAGTQVVAIERSAEQIREARRQAEQAGETDLVDLREGDAFEPPIAAAEWGRFDVAHTRFLLEHLRDPLRVVQHMIRMVRPGGRIILADDDYETLRLWPEPPGFSSIWSAHNRTYDRHGNDPQVGRRLVQLLHQAGAAPCFNTLVFFGSCAGQPEFSHFARNLISVLEEAVSDMSETGLTDEQIRRALSELEAWSLFPDAALWYGLYWAEGIRL